MSTAAYPEDPAGDMVPILEASIEAAKERHPSGKAVVDAPAVGTTEVVDIGLGLACDEACPQPALHRLRLGSKSMELDFCSHHYGKHFPGMKDFGWAIVGTSFELANQLAKEGV